MSTANKPPPKRRLKINVRLLRLGLRSQVLLDPAVVNTQELVHPSRHVDIILLALGALLVQEAEHRIILRRRLQKDGHYLEKRLAKLGRASLGRVAALRLKRPGLAHAGVYSRERSQRTAVGKPGYIPDLRHDLRAEGWTDAAHRQDDGIFR